MTTSNITLDKYTKAAQRIRVDLIQHVYGNTKYFYRNTYLIHLPIPRLVHCYECNHITGLYIEWRPFIKTGRKRKKNPWYIPKNTLLIINEDNFKVREGSEPEWTKGAQ